MPNNGLRPVLWHLAMSHYNEKARWALEYKRISHTRRAVLPGLHVLVAFRLGGRQTFPVMTIGDTVYPDSTDIIAALEERQPDPPLYPSDPALRVEALELEDELDRKLGPAVRRLGYQHILENRDAALMFLSRGGPPLRRTMLEVGFAPLAAMMRTAFGIPAAADSRPRATVEHYLQIIEDRTAETGYLVGDTFTVADLTAAALTAVIVRPEVLPGPPLPELPPALKEFQRAAMDRPAGRWIEHMYLSHRPGVQTVLTPAKA